MVLMGEIKRIALVKITFVKDDRSARFFSFPTPEMRKISVLLSLYIGLEKGTFAETTAY